MKKTTGDDKRILIDYIFYFFNKGFKPVITTIGLILLSLLIGSNFNPLFLFISIIFLFIAVISYLFFEFINRLLGE